MYRRNFREDILELKEVSNMPRPKRDMKKIAKGVFWIHRPHFAIIGFLTAIAGIFLAGVFDLILMLEVGLLFWFLHAIAHPINDYIDRESDKIGRPNAPIPMKMLTLKQVKIIIGLDYIIAAILILILPLNFPAKIFAAIFLLHAYFFSAPPIHATAKGILASITLSTAFATAFIGGWAAAAGWRYEPVLISLSLLIGSLNMTAKNVVDILDVGSDKKSGRITLPMQIGVKKTFYIAAFFGLFTIFSFSLAYFVGSMNIFYLIVGVIGSIIVLLGLFNFQKDYGKVKGRKYYGIFLLPTFIFPIAIILGSI